MISGLLAALVLVGNECVWAELDHSSADQMIVECNQGGGWYACGITPDKVDSGPFGVSSVNYIPVLRLEVPGVLPGDVFEVRAKAANSYGESGPTASVALVWPEVWDGP